MNRSPVIADGRSGAARVSHELLPFAVGLGYGFAAGRREYATSSDMDSIQPRRPTALSPLERAYIRRELNMFFSTLPRVSDGFPLKTWRSGVHAGKPKIPTAAADMVARGLLALDTTTRPARLVFTEAGLAALREMMADKRLAEPTKFRHVRQELGLESGEHAVNAR